MKSPLLIRLLLVAVVPVALYFLLLGGEYSLFDLRRAEAELELRRDEMRQLHQSIDSLNARIHALDSNDETLERIARERYGFIRDGETLYRIVEPDSVSR